MLGQFITADIYGSGIAYTFIPPPPSGGRLLATADPYQASIQQGYVAGNLTNSFRQQNGLSPLTWNILVHDQAY